MSVMMKSIVSVLCVFGFGGVSAFAEAAYVPGEVLIKFKGTSTAALLATSGANNGIHTMALKSVRATVLRRAAVLKIEQWKLPAGMTTIAAIKQLQSNPNVEFVEPNYRRFIRAIPNDPSFSKQWALSNTGQTIHDSSGAVVTGTAGSDMGLVTAWNTQTGSKNVIVAVIDDSIDINHPDLKANIWTNPGEIAGDGIDNDGNGYVDDVHGWDFKANDNDPSADPGAGEGHGTAVAGTIGAVANNAIGVAGVNWTVSIMPLKFAKDVASEVMAMDYAIAKGAHIINASFGAPGKSSQSERAAVQRLQVANILLVAAAGNSDGNNDWVLDSPSGILSPNVLAVGASNSVDRITSWSHYGATTVDVVAPGTSVYTTQSINGNHGNIGTAGVLYDFIQGTSFSSPYVAGIAALIKAQFPNAGFQELKGRIMAAATPLTSLQGLLSSGGRVDAATALTVPVQPVLVIGDVAWNDGVNGNGFMNPGETGSMVVQIDNVWANATAVSATMTALSANLTVNTAVVSYSTIASGGNQVGNFNVTAAAVNGYQVYKFKLDISAAGGYAVTRYYQIGQGVLASGALYNATLGTNEQDDYQIFAVDIPAGASNLSVHTTSGQDIDLMVTDNAVPVFDYATYFNNPAPVNTQMAATLSGNESINIVNPTVGKYVVTVLKPATGSNIAFTIIATVTTPVAAAATTGTTTTTAASSSGGCVIAPNARFDPALIALFLLSLLFYAKRGRCAM